MTMMKISELLIEQDAIIFGGFVRDQYIHTHYADAFYRDARDRKKYDDEDYHPETRHRLLIPKDIDVFIKGNEDDVQKVYSSLEPYGFEVIIKRLKRIYNRFEHIGHQKVTIHKHVLGLPVVKIDLDILFSLDDVRPPFKRLDLWCNSLIMDKTGIRLSDQTGSPVDNWTHFDRKKFEIQILQDILKFETIKVDFDEEQGKKNKETIRIRTESMKNRGWIIKDISL
jgi:hypothetical protein